MNNSFGEFTGRLGAVDKVPDPEADRGDVYEAAVA